MITAKMEMNEFTIVATTKRLVEEGRIVDINDIS